MASLTWNTPQGPKEHRLLAETRIGRSPKNDICLPDAGVSASHARILREGSFWIIEDTGSKNGTYVNDGPQTRFVLRDGDVIGIGTATLTFRMAERAPEPASEVVPEAAGAPVPETETLLWRRGPADAPIPVDLADTPAPGRRTTFATRWAEGEAKYTRISSVDPKVFTTSVLPARGEDSTQLARRLKATYEISRATAATLDPAQILDRVLGALLGIFDKADRAFILLAELKTGEVSMAAARQRSGRAASEKGISRTALEAAMRNCEAVLCRDASADERFARAQSIVGLGIRSMMIAPLLFRDEVLGAVHVDTLGRVGEFAQADLELLSVAASDVASYLANARLHEKVVAAERLAAVGQTLAGLTHCIKNILQGIKGGAYILERGIEKADLDRVRSGWEMVRRNNGFMEELVWDLLTYSKERTPEYAATDVNALASEICQLVGERAKSKGVALTLLPDPALPSAEVDPKGIRRCLLNLVANALDACESGGAVTVEVRAPADDGLFRILVRDTGCGMSPETLAKLFSVFFSTKGSKGTGLGLPVTQKIIEEHGGQIRVESREGVGTTFTICLPPRHPQSPQP